jgi:hypothetical protein
MNNFCRLLTPNLYSLTMINRVWLFKLCYWLVDQLPLLHRVQSLSDACEKRILLWIKGARRQPVVFFAKTDEPHILNKAILYCQKNEPSGNVKIVHLYQSLDDIPKHFEANHRMIDEIYPKIQIDLVSSLISILCFSIDASNNTLGKSCLFKELSTLKLSKLSRGSLTYPLL